MRILRSIPIFCNFLRRPDAMPAEIATCWLHTDTNLRGYSHAVGAAVAHNVSKVDMASTPAHGGAVGTSSSTCASRSSQAQSRAVSDSRRSSSSELAPAPLTVPCALPARTSLGMITKQPALAGMLLGFAPGQQRRGTSAPALMTRLGPRGQSRPMAVGSLPDTSHDDTRETAPASPSWTAAGTQPEADVQRRPNKRGRPRLPPAVEQLPPDATAAQIAKARRVDKRRRQNRSSAVNCRARTKQQLEEALLELDQLRVVNGHLRSSLHNAQRQCDALKLRLREQALQRRAWASRAPQMDPVPRLFVHPAAGVGVGAAMSPYRPPFVPAGLAVRQTLPVPLPPAAMPSSEQPAGSIVAQARAPIEGHEAWPR